MPYTSLDQLANAPAGSIADKLEICTASEDTIAASFYPEDILRVAAQSGYSYMRKYMATFWGYRYQVWVGHNSSDAVLPGAIALRCPPYYPPHSYPGVYVAASPIPPGFPTMPVPDPG